MKSFWMSWYHTPELGGFELSSPWWKSGVRLVATESGEIEEHPTICAAIRADHLEGAMDRVLTGYDVRPDDVEWRFFNEKPDDWSPFSERFPKADWMEWPPLNHVDTEISLKREA